VAGAAIRGLLALLLALAGVTVGVAGAADSFPVVDAFEERGAHGLIVVPESWNGALVVYAHGYEADWQALKAYPSDLTPADIGTRLEGGDVLLQIPLALGYAVGTTRYRATGFAVEEAWRDVDAVRRRFIRRHGEPRFTYVWGSSLGGLVAATVIERQRGGWDGALPMCAPLGGSRRLLNAFWDARAAYEHVCGAVPGAALRCGLCSNGVDVCLDDADCPGGACSELEPASPPEQGMSKACTDLVLGDPATATPARIVDLSLRRGLACFGLSGTGSLAQQARRDRFTRALEIAPEFDLSLVFFGSLGLAEVVHRRTGGLVPWSNVGVEERSPLVTPSEAAALDASIPRASSDGRATAMLRRFYEPRGRTDAKVVSLHALDDGVVFPEHEDAYRQTFGTARRPEQLLSLLTSGGGHCAFTVGETVAAFTALTAWVEEGVTPTVAGVQQACEALAVADGVGPCRIVDGDPGSWGARVPEREQDGVRARQLACDGDAEDCPPGTTCSMRIRRCVASGG
jgi:hypothetical protein